MVLDPSLNAIFTDFEDAVQYYSGINAGIDCVVTRNVKVYKNTKLAIYTPIELLGVLKE